MTMEQLVYGMKKRHTARDADIRFLALDQAAERWLWTKRGRVARVLMLEKCRQRAARVYWNRFRKEHHITLGRYGEP